MTETAELEQKIDELQQEHAALGAKLDLMESDPLVDHLEIQEIKKQKLFLKDSIQIIQRQLHS